MSHFKRFKFVTILVLVFKKIESEDKTKYDDFYLSSKAGINFNESVTDDMFESIYTTNITITTNMKKYFGKGSAWVIDAVIDHIISISKYNLLAGSSYIKSLK